MGTPSCSATGPSTPVPTPIGTWIRYTATFDGQVIRCYRDGTLSESSRVPAGSGLLPAEALVIGRNYPGDVDALRIFGRALDETEIQRPWP